MEDISARTVRRLGHGILISPGMKQERGFIQHGDVSVLEHSFMVAVLCVAIGVGIVFIAYHRLWGGAML